MRHFFVSLQNRFLSLLLSLLLAFLLPFGLTGCTGAQAAQRAEAAITAVLNIAAVEVAVVPVADQAAYKGFIALAQNVNGQLQTCITNVSGITGKGAKFLSCFNTFAQGLLSPTELAQLRILSPATAAKVQLYVTAIVAGVNIAVAAFGGTAVPVPAVGAAPSASELAPIYREMHRAAFGD